MKGLVLSGGGARAAYQIGVLKALYSVKEKGQPQFQLIFGSSIGAVNGVLLAAGLRTDPMSALSVIEQIWLERTFSNSFSGTLSMTFLRSLRVGFLQYLQPGPGPTATAIFDPSPLSRLIDETMFKFGGANVLDHPSGIEAIAVTATEEGLERKSVLLANYKTAPDPELMRGSRFRVHEVNNFAASHVLASAALPYVLPPVELDIDKATVNLVDGGIANNLPVDPCVRFGASEVTLIDTSGKKWWHDYYGRPYYTAEAWAIDSPVGSSCLLPTKFRELTSNKSFGAVLIDSIGNSPRDVIRALGPIWPVYQYLTRTMGRELGLEVVSYAVIYPPYIRALIDLGYTETIDHIENSEPQFQKL